MSISLIFFLFVLKGLSDSVVAHALMLGYVVDFIIHAGPTVQYSFRCELSLIRCHQRSRHEDLVSEGSSMQRP